MPEDFRPRLEDFFDAFGVEATVTLPPPDDDTPITTTIIWLPELTEELPVGSRQSRRSPRRIVAVRRDEVPTLPTGTTITAPLLGVELEAESPQIRTWRVDAPVSEDMRGNFAGSDSEHHRALVVEVAG